VFDDLQRTDATTVSFIEHVLEWATAPILIVGVARSEARSDQPHWSSLSDQATVVEIEPLPSAEVGELLKSMVDGLPASAASTIIRRCEGVPLYIVEIVRALLAEGHVLTSGDRLVATDDMIDITVPESLTALVASRLDRLDPVDRALVLDASVLGDRFSLAAINSVTDLDADAVPERLQRLVTGTVLAVVDDETSPERGQYGFVQGLVREVAYHTLARRDRASRHVRVARYIEQLDNAALVGLVAFHDLAACTAMATSSDSERFARRAVASALTALTRSLSLAAFSDVVALASHVLELAPDALERARLLEARARAFTELGHYEQATADVEAAMSIYRDDDPHVLELTGVLAEALVRAGSYDRARQLLEGATTRPDAALDQSRGDRLRLLLARVLDFQGASAAGFATADVVTLRAERYGDLALLADALVTKGTCCGRLGRIDEGIDAITEGIAITERISGDHGVRLRGIINRAWLMLDHQPRRAFDAVIHALDIARRLGAGSSERILITFLVELSYHLGEWDVADEALIATDLDRFEGVDAAVLTTAAIDLDAARGRDVSPWLDRLSQLSTVIDERHFEGYRRQAAVAIANAEGRFADAATAAWSAAETSGDVWPASWLLAARAALWAGNPTLAADALQHLTGKTQPAAIAARHAALNATITAAIDEREAIPDGVMVAHAELIDLGLHWDATLTALDTVIVFPDDRRNHDALQHARRFLERVGATPYLAHLDAPHSRNLA
jgi:tetratricopeptide (TPR) repeat protein